MERIERTEHEARARAWAQKLEKEDREVKGHIFIIKDILKEAEKRNLDILLKH